MRAASPPTRRLMNALAVLALMAIALSLLLACGEDENGGRGSGTDTPASPTVTNPPASPTGDQPITHPTGADEPVLRIEYEGGFVPPELLISRLPVFVLYGDGCYVVEGPQIEIYPQPALPNLLETCLTEEGVQTLLAKAKAAGLLDGDAEYPNNTIADAPTTVITTNAGGVRTVVRAYALGLDAADDPTLTPEQVAARKKLAEFVQQITGASGWLAPEMIAEPEHAYDWTRLQVVSTPVQPDAGSSATPEPIEPQELDWPLADLATLGEPYVMEGQRCFVVEGQDLVTLKPQLEKANQLTLWTSGDATYHLTFRPLLPDEPGCQAPRV